MDKFLNRLYKIIANLFGQDNSITRFFNNSFKCICYGFDHYCSDSAMFAQCHIDDINTNT